MNQATTNEVPVFLWIGGYHLIQRVPNVGNVSKRRNSTFQIALNLQILFVAHARLVVKDITRRSAVLSILIRCALLAVHARTGLHMQHRSAVAQETCWTLIALLVLPVKRVNISFLVAFQIRGLLLPTLFAHLAQFVDRTSITLKFARKLLTQCARPVKCALLMKSKS